MPNVYYAVCPGTGGTSDKKTGSPTITISSGVATLSVAQTGNIGQGFRITYDTSKVCFISKVNSATSFDVVTATGGTPSNEASPVTVNSIAADYASLSAAEAGASDANHLNTLDLVTATTILNLVCYAGASADATSCNIDGYTASADYYMHVYAANGGAQSLSINRHSGIWDASKYIITATGAQRTITLNDVYIRVTGLQIDASPLTHSSSGGLVSYNQDYIDSCIIRDDGGCYVGYGPFGGGPHTIVNSVIYGFTLSSGYAGIDFYNCTSTSLVYNCTVFSNYRGFWGESGTVHIYNSAFFNNYDDITTSSSSLTIDYCASDDNDGTHTQDLADSAASWNAQFADYDATNPDVRLVGNSLLLMTGIGPALDSNVPTTDIVGTSRSGNTCDIGAFEYVASGGGGVSIIPIIMNHLQKMRAN